MSTVLHHTLTLKQGLLAFQKLVLLWLQVQGIASLFWSPAREVCKAVDWVIGVNLYIRQVASDHVCLVLVEQKKITFKACLVFSVITLPRAAIELQANLFFLAILLINVDVDELFLSRYGWGCYSCDVRYGLRHSWSRVNARSFYLRYHWLVHLWFFFNNHCQFWQVFSQNTASRCQSVRSQVVMKAYHRC